jgi:hypothetical protein
MIEEEAEENGLYSLSSTGRRHEKKSKSRKVKTKQETSSMTSSSLELSSTSLSSVVVLHGGKDRTVTASGEMKNWQSTSTTRKHAANLSSKPAHDSATPLVKASALQHVLAITNSIDENKNTDVFDAARNDAADANNTSNCTDLSEDCIMSTRKAREKYITAKSNHSRSGRRGDRSIRNMQSGTLSRGSNSIRSGGSQKISRSSHCSISAHTMASSLDTCTDADLDSLDGEDDSNHELLSDNDNDDYRHQDQLYEKFRRHLTSSNDDDDINEYDPLWREKTQYDKYKISNKLGAPPSSSYLHRYSVGAEELHKAAGQSESTEPTAIAAPLSTLVDEMSTKLLPKQDSSVEEIRSPSLPHQQPQINGPKEDNPLLTTEDEGFSGLGSQSSYGNFERRLSPLKRKVLGAKELSKQYSHHSEDYIQKEKLQDYDMSLEKKPNTTSRDSNGDDDFLEISDHAINSELIRRSSLSTTSSDTLNSSNRQDSLSDRGFETESSVISQTLRNSISHASSTFRSSLNLRDSDRDRDISFEFFKTAELTSSSLAKFRDSQTDSSGVSLSDDKQFSLETSLSTRSRSRKELNLKLRNHLENDMFWIRKKNRRPNNGIEVTEFHSGQLVPMERRHSFSETDPEISEDFYDCFFLPCEEPKSSGCRADLDLTEIHQKASRMHCGVESAMKVLSPSDHHSNCLMEYSISHYPGDNVPIDTTQSHELEKSSLPSSVRIRRHVIRGLCALFILLACGLTLYFFFRFDNNADEKYPTQIDPLFLINP